MCFACFITFSVNYFGANDDGVDRCQPLTEWKVLGVGDGGLVPHLVVGVGTTISCPVKIPTGTERQSVSVIFPAAEETEVQQMLVREYHCWNYGINRF